MKDKLKTYNEFFVGKIISTYSKNGEGDPVYSYIILEVLEDDDQYEYKTPGVLIFDGFCLHDKQIYFGCEIKVRELDSLIKYGKYEDSSLLSEII